MRTPVAQLLLRGMLLLFATAAFGQELPDAPSFTQSTQTPQTRIDDKAFWITSGAYGASVAGDAITTSLWVGKTTGCPREVGSPALYGTRPRAARTTLIMAGEFALTTLVSYEFKKHNAHIGKIRLWQLPMLARTYAHGYGTINNIAACR